MIERIEGSGAMDFECYIRRTSLAGFNGGMWDSGMVSVTVKQDGKGECGL
jgi:hypothetical protein